MKMSIYQRKKIDELKDRARALYVQGLTTRKVAELIGRSHNWVAMAVKIVDKKESIEERSNKLKSPPKRASHENGNLQK